ncbi:MAG: hypothetical protein IT563_20180 [Alphaproteobacteria bacterium]|nr:hypothetical protein [Alphaproteobacteria bacterium]
MASQTVLRFPGVREGGAAAGGQPATSSGEGVAAPAARVTPIEAAGALAVMNLLQESQSALAVEATGGWALDRSLDGDGEAGNPEVPAAGEQPLPTPASFDLPAPALSHAEDRDTDRALDLARAFWSGSEPQVVEAPPTPAVTIVRDEQGTATLQHFPPEADASVEAIGRAVVVAPIAAALPAPAPRARRGLGIAVAAAALICAAAAAWTLYIPATPIAAIDAQAVKPAPVPTAAIAAPTPAPIAQPQIVPPAPPPPAAAPTPAAPPLAASVPAPAPASPPPVAAKPAPSRERVAAPAAPSPAAKPAAVKSEAPPAVASPPRESPGLSPPPRATREDIAAARPVPAPPPPIVPDRAPPLVDSGAVILRAALPVAPPPAPPPQPSKPIILPNLVDAEGAAVAVVHLPAPAPPPAAPLAAPAPTELAKIEPSASPAPSITAQVVARIPAPTAALPPVAPAPAAAAAAPPPASAAGPAIDPVQAEAMMRRADSLAAIGDLSGARLFYEKLALAGSRPAALALARSYDPDWLRLHRVMGVPPDSARAAYWYTRAGITVDPRKPDLAQQPRS